LRQDVKEFQLFLQHNLPHGSFKVAEVIKSGSLGKGTAVRDTADIDLVVYVDGVTTIKELKRARPGILNHLKERVEEYGPWKGKIELKKQTKYALSYKYGNHDVDILPALNVKRHIGSPAQIYDKMESPKKRARDSKNGRRRRNRQAQEYSASLAPLQKAFIKQQPPQVKDAIRLLKYWKQREKGKLNSVQLFQKSLQELSNSPSLAIAFDENYDPKEFTEKRNLPYIMDPANPYMNTFAGVKSRKARRRAGCMCTKFNSYVDAVVRTIHQISYGDYSVKEVIKADFGNEGGSLGKGTATSDSDIDLVVYFNGLHSIEDLKRMRPKLIELIEKQIRGSCSTVAVPYVASYVSSNSGVIRWPEKQPSDFSLQFTLDDIGVDVLPAFDALAELRSPDAIYKAMERYPGGVHEAAQQYSASLTSLQRDFVKQVDSRIKDAIREMKDWSDKHGPRKSVRSYGLELLAIYMYKPQMSKDELMRKCMEQLANCGSLRVAFNTNYDSSRYTRFMQVPYIMDPANPYKNVIEGVDADGVSRAANAYLRSH
ncbi:hypothetical protein BaRGS_00030395, partial [Batillaria attramentaria]